MEVAVAGLHSPGGHKAGFHYEDDPVLSSPRLGTRPSLYDPAIDNTPKAHAAMSDADPSTLGPSPRAMRRQASHKGGGGGEFKVFGNAAFEDDSAGQALNMSGGGGVGSKSRLGLAPSLGVNSLVGDDMGMAGSARSRRNSAIGAGNLNASLSGCDPSHSLNQSLRSVHDTPRGGRSLNGTLNASFKSQGHNAGRDLDHAFSMGRGSGESRKTGHDHVYDEDVDAPQRSKSKSRLSFFRRKSQCDAEGGILDAGTQVRAFEDNVEDFPLSGMRQKSVSRAGAAKPHASPRTSSALWEVHVKQMIASGVRTEALTLTGPTDDFIRCYVMRKKGLFGTHPTLELYLENGDTFLMAARKRKKTKTSSYILCSDADDMTRESEACAAKLKACFSGWEYVLWSRSDAAQVKKGFGKQSMVMNFKTLSKGFKGGPRGLQIAVPIPDTDWQPPEVEGDGSLSGMLALAKEKQLPPEDEQNLAFLISKQPDYDKATKSYVLDFGGRVQEASVKNFQLVAWDHNTGTVGEQPLVIFGKQDKDLFALDFRSPMCVETAFAAAVASMDTKLCCAV